MPLWRAGTSSVCSAPDFQSSSPAGTVCAEELSKLGINCLFDHVGAWRTMLFAAKTARLPANSWNTQP